MSEPRAMSSAERIESSSGTLLRNAILFVMVLAAVALESWISPAPAPILAAIGAALGTIGILIRRRLPEAILIVLFVSLAFVHELSSPALTIPIRIFWIDLLLAPVLVAGILELLERGRLPKLGRHFLMIVAFSVLWTVIGVARGQNALDAIGVFRRVALYPSIYLVTAAVFETRPVPIKGVRMVVISSAVAIALHTVWRLITGEGYAHDYFEAAGGAEAGGVSRWTSYLEILAPVLAMGMVAGDFINATTIRRRLLSTFAAALLLFPVVASNYRSAWGAFFLGAGIWLFLSGHKTVVVIRQAAVVILLAGVIGGAIYALADEQGLPTQKFSLENLRRTTNWRGASWKRAAEVFRESPVTGVGFGYRHVFRYQSTPESPVSTAVATVHNDALWILVDAGILGALLILGFHVRWLITIIRGAGRAKDEQARALTAAIVGAYVTMAVIAMFQPVFSVPAVVLSVSTLMAIGVTIVEREAG
jgi:O-antigen ligase